MGNFKNFIEATGIIKQDFSHLSKQERLAIGKDQGEKFIKDELLKHGVRIVTVSGQMNQDTKLKIDGYLNGMPSEPVQIKLRKTNRDGKEDIAYELVLGYDPRIPVKDQLADPRRQGRDYKGTGVKHYFVLNSSETEIYHIPAEALKNAAMQAVQEASNTIVDRDHPFVSSQGVELRATVDNSSGIPKLMAFIPANRVYTQSYMVGAGTAQLAPAANTMTKKDFNIAAHKARLEALQAKQRADNEARKARMAQAGGNAL